MKKTMLFTVMALTVTILISSCQKKETGPSYYMKSETNFGLYGSNNCHAIIVGGDELHIVGTNGYPNALVYPIIDLVIPYWRFQTGIYPCDSFERDSVPLYSTGTATSDIHTAKFGSVNITSNTASTISGTFYFTTTDGKTFSNGSFTAKKYF